MVKMKQDKYRKVRGGKAQMLDVFCANCNKQVLFYQKDGDGNLLRCYLNRIFAPPQLEKLQHDSKIHEPKDMPNLICDSCSTLIGVPMRYQDGRLAFRLFHGSFYKRKSKREDIENAESQEIQKS